VVLAILAMAVLGGLTPAAAGGRPAVAGAVSSPVALVITSVSPAVATQRGKVTVSGDVTNTTATALTGLSLQLWSSPARLTSRTEMATYLGAAGPGGIDQPLTLTSAVTTISALPAHATQHWSLSFKPASAGMSTFGVYPLAVQASQGGFALATGRARTFLPYYPNVRARSAPRKLKIAWVWPVVGTPQQTACRGLRTDGLARALSGRLGRLVTAGAGPAGRDAQLTWAIDPSVLNGARTMAHTYRVGQSPTCTGGSVRQPSAAARSWLAKLKAATARADFFVTPYADVDVAALSHHGLVSELASAFSYGRSVARSILGQPQRPAAPEASGSATTSGLAAGTTPTASGPRTRPPLGMIAWPADGLADYGVLSSLAVNHVGTVVLDSTMMPPSAQTPFTPSGVATTTTQPGNSLNVLLTDDRLDQLVASAPTAANPGGAVRGTPPQIATAAAAFATEQQFRAETAMIVAESPATARSIVIAPPRRWNPAPGLAEELLSETASSPWLQPASLASLAQGKPGPGAVRRRQPPPSQRSPSELRPSLLHQVRKLTTQIDLHASILAKPPSHYLSAAVAAVESSAWRGSRAGERRASALAGRIQDYLTAQQRALQIVHTQRVTLGGKSGSVPVSLSNHLRQSVTVVVKVSAPSQDRIAFGKSASKFASQVTVQAGKQRTIKIPVQSAVAGSTTLTIQLCNRHGTPLPGDSATLTVSATYFGTLAMVIIGIAFGVFVLASIVRAIRRGGRPGSDGPDAPGGSEGTGPDAAKPASGADGPDTVGAGRAEQDHAPEEADEHASARGRADPR